MRAVALALVGLVVLAGCSAPVADRSPTTTAEPPSITVQNGTLEADPGVVFLRVQELLGTNVSAPDRVRMVEDPDAIAPGVERRVPRVWRLLGVEHARAPDVERDRLENGATTGMGAIRLYPGDGAARDVEWLLAHEFVHYVQFVRGDDTTLRRALDRTTDAGFVTRAVLEGIAVNATDAYIDRHLGEGSNAAVYDRLQDQLPQGSVSRYANLAYIAGHRYIAERTEGPAAAGAVYTDPPRTSEQLLHRTDEPPAALPVAVETVGWRHVGADRLGEAFLRVALESGVSPERAASAAAGWGNDTLVMFRPVGGGDASYVWVVRFDDENAATEGAAALRGSLSARGNRTAEGWRVAGVHASLSRPDDRTVALALGSGVFVDSVGVAADSGTVEISVDDPESA